MARYVALLRGIGPGNPNMRNDKLRATFEKVGFTEVKSVISSGNILFESAEKDQQKLEAKIEAALPRELGFSSIAIVRSRHELQRLVKHDPFAGISHTRETHLNVTFLKEKVPAGFALPPAPPDNAYRIIKALDREIYVVVDLNKPRAAQFMAWVKKQLGNKNTTRSWQTVHKILKAFNKESV